MAPDDRSVADAIVANRDHLPALHLDCGSDDPLIEPNRRLHAALDSAGVDHEWAVHPGGHEWTYWRDHLAEVLIFAGRHF